MIETRSIDKPQRIRVMLVEDSPIELHLLRNMFATADDMELVGIAKNGLEALRLLPQLRPDVVCTDYHMPVMDGLEFITLAMQQHPCPILVLSCSVQPDQKNNIFRLLSAGALDVMAKPIGHGGHLGPASTAPLLAKIRAIVNAPVEARKHLHTLAQRQGKHSPHGSARPARSELVAIGSSTGGPQVLQQILSQLPQDFQAPVVCVQHISEGFLPGMIDWLQSSCQLKIQIAQAGDSPQRSEVYFAPDGHHLMLDVHRRFRLEACKATSLHCPGIDPLMESVARHYGPAGMGIVLSGMGRDGAVGLKAMHEAGATTVAQDEHSCVIFGMPAAAISMGAARHVLPTDEIARLMLRQVT